MLGDWILNSMWYDWLMHSDHQSQLLYSSVFVATGVPFDTTTAPVLL